MSSDRERRWPAWRTVAIAVGIAGVLGAAATALVLSGSSKGSAAIERTQQAAAPGLADFRDAAAARGETLDVSWSAVPDPRRNDLHMVTARFELRPSGRVTSAAFLVRGARVIPQDALARRLAAARAR